MEERIIKFISSLRAAGVRISLAESEDALNAIGQMGVRDRSTFYTSLRTTLVKDSKDHPVFDELFPLFRIFWYKFIKIFKRFPFWSHPPKLEVFM